MDIRKLDRTAVLETVRVLGQASARDWDRPTPCAEWTLRELVAHMAGQHHGFAAAATGGGADLADWQPSELGDDPLATYCTAAEAVLHAFARPGVLSAEFALPEISTTRRFPASLAIGFHFLDYVVHGWDVARALGVTLELDEETVRAAGAIAQRVPDDERRTDPEALFKPALPARPDASALDLVLTSLGRSPEWSAAAPH
ncbi:TIGR03086 family metal-binding protein [Streptomyces sp. 71268]|uniref:TIGR03086 family metal-binding protein n=1 Tax=Streptomyces sp. 71268 TaxID=3002640 RepID=UPI0023F7E279|nr:TIGR03086 family metal-binding protein [Streptomyces sp. 71268]WEV24339.1 TIGR03086 family metal-binding protein [Streptomyces sp. 71268]